MYGCAVGRTWPPDSSDLRRLHEPCSSDGRDADAAVARASSPVELRDRRCRRAARGGSSASSLSSAATITRFAGPARRITSGLSCWLPRPNSVALAADDDDDDASPGRPSSSVEQLRLAQIAADEPAVLDRIDAEQRPLAGRGGRGRAASSCRGRRVERAAAASLVGELARRARRAPRRPGATRCLRPLDAQAVARHAQRRRRARAETRPSRSASSSMSIDLGLAQRAAERPLRIARRGRPRPPGSSANTPECIFTPVGMPEHRHAGADRVEDVARRAVAAGEQDQVDPAARQLARRRRGCRRPGRRRARHRRRTSSSKPCAARGVGAHRAGRRRRS